MSFEFIYLSILFIVDFLFSLFLVSSIPLFWVSNFNWSSCFYLVCVCGGGGGIGGGKPLFCMLGYIPTTKEGFTFIIPTFASHSDFGGLDYNVFIVVFLVLHIIVLIMIISLVS
jgi:hypothetical protein